MRSYHNKVVTLPLLATSINKSGHFKRNGRKWRVLTCRLEEEFSREQVASFSQNSNGSPLYRLWSILYLNCREWRSKFSKIWTWIQICFKNWGNFIISWLSWKRTVTRYFVFRERERERERERVEQDDEIER